MRDDQKTSFDIEPLIPEEASRTRPALNDLALELATVSAELSASLPLAVRAPLAALVRSMNCYYSNLIEGHDTHPIDIERAGVADGGPCDAARNGEIRRPVVRFARVGAQRGRL